MSDSPDKRTQLLAETFHEDWTSGRPAEFARRAAAHARRRRAVRRTLGATAVVATAAVVAGAFLLSHPEPSPSVSAPVRSAPVRVATALQPATVEPSASTARGYEVISDEELLRQLHGETLIVVKKANGAREILLLTNE